MSCVIYGQEKTRFTLNIDDPNGAVKDNTTDWTITDKDMDGNDNTLTETDISYKDTVDMNFKSPGDKDINVVTDFDDGWGNTYQHQTLDTVTVYVYDQPVIDFSWDPENPVIKEDVTFTQNNDDTRDDSIPKAYGEITKVNFDIFNDGEYEETDLGADDSFTYSFAEKHKTVDIKQEVYYWDGFETKEIELIKTLEMSNLPPDTEYDQSCNDYRVPFCQWTATSTDPDDDDNSLTHTWQLYVVIEDSSGNETDELIKEGTGEDFDHKFVDSGKYKIKLTSTDPDGNSTTKEDTFDVDVNACDADGGSVGIASESAVEYHGHPSPRNIWAQYHRTSLRVQSN